MKLPINITTITELDIWVDKNNPKIIEIPHNANIKQIREFGKKWWHYFYGIPLIYEKE